MLLYIGPMTDIRPLLRFSHAHKDFVYVDGLPASGYNKWYQTEDDLIISMTQALQNEKAFKKCTKKDGYFILETIGGQKLYYFYNTLDVDMFDKPILKDFLQNVTTLYMAGYTPIIAKPLINLQTIVGTGICSPYSKFQFGNNKEIVQWEFDWKTLEYLHLPKWDNYLSDGSTVIASTFDSCKNCRKSVTIYEYKYISHKMMTNL